MILPKLDNRKKIILGLPLFFLFFLLIWSFFLYLQGGISPLMAIRAYFAGYSLAYQGSYFDITGRTILADKSRYTPDLFDDLGGGAFYSDEPAWWKGVGLSNRIYGVGILKEWEEIPGSKDKYLLATGPKDVGELQLRLIFEPRGDPWGRYNTTLCVDDLSLDTNDLANLNGKPIFAPLVLLSRLPQEEIDKLLRPGDTFSFTLRYSGQPTGRPLKGELLLDDFEKVVISNLILRRYGGEKRLEKELGKSFAEYNKNYIEE